MNIDYCRKDVPFESKLGCQEVFGPVLTLASIEGLEDGIKRVNASRYGIHASVFTNDAIAIEKAERELEVGGVVINEFPTLRFDDLPYGGVKDSGFGREGVRFAVEEMSEPKSLVKRRS